MIYLRHPASSSLLRINFTETIPKSGEIRFSLASNIGAQLALGQGIYDAEAKNVPWHASVCWNICYIFRSQICEFAMMLVLQLGILVVRGSNVNFVAPLGARNSQAPEGLQHAEISFAYFCWFHIP